MNKMTGITAVFVCLMLGLSLVHAQPAAFSLSIDAFPNGGTIPIRHSQAAPDAAPGGGTSPALSWSNAPEGTRSFVVHMHDLDFGPARNPATQVHWVVWNIPADATGLDEGLPAGNPLPNGALQISATGEVYRGPGAPATRPPHHYLFEVYALDTVLDVMPGDDAIATREAVMEAMRGHVLARSVYFGRFNRPQ